MICINRMTGIIVPEQEWATILSYYHLIDAPFNLSSQNLTCFLFVFVMSASKKPNPKPKKRNRVADEDDPDELNSLCTRYYEGDGVTKDYKKAFELGARLLRGVGAEQDIPKAVAMLQRAAELGSEEPLRLWLVSFAISSIVMFVVQWVSV